MALPPPRSSGAVVYRIMELQYRNTVLVQAKENGCTTAFGLRQASSDDDGLDAFAERQKLAGQFAALFGEAL
jgi:hypothetical protein